MISNRTARIIERATGAARVGRIVPEPAKNYNSIIVFAAHPDDDVLGVGITVRRHILEGRNVIVVFTTNGVGHERSKRLMRARFTKRYQEATLALARAGIGNDGIFCLGYPDGRLYRYMGDLAHDVRQIILQTAPAFVYVHSIEGGHRDHDITGFVVQDVCRRIGYRNLYEWAEYNKFHPLGCSNVGFAPDPTGANHELLMLELSPSEFALKMKMLRDHRSQWESMDFKSYGTRNEVLRAARLENLEQKLTHFWSFDRGRLRCGLRDYRDAVDSDTST